MGAHEQLTPGPNVPSPETKYKRSKNAFPVTFIAPNCVRMCSRLLQLLAQSLIGSPGTLGTTLQDIARHYKTLQDTARHCKTLQILFHSLPNPSFRAHLIKYGGFFSSLFALSQLFNGRGVGSCCGSDGADYFCHERAHRETLRNLSCNPTCARAKTN